MSNPPTSFSVALTSLIDRLYDGNRSALSRACGIPAPTLYTLSSPTVSPSKVRLEAIADVLPRGERQKILLAAAQDAVPRKYHGEMMDGGGYLGRSRLPHDLLKVVLFLEEEAFSDADAAGMLRSIGRWAGVLEEEVLSAVAEDPVSYNTPLD